MIGFATKAWEGLEGMGVEALEEEKPRAEHSLMMACVYFVSELKLTLTGQRSGLFYKISKTGRLHQASAPGEAPAVLYGALRNSAGHSQPVWDGWSVSAEVGIGLGTRPGGGGADPETYARRLEFGGIDSRGVRILPRPYLEPTVIRTAAQIDQLLEG